MAEIGIKSFEELGKALGELILEKGTGPFHEEINYYNVLGLINSFEASVKDAIKIIDECSENETHLDDELCKKCPLYKEGEAGIFCSYWILRRVIEGEGGGKGGDLKCELLACRWNCDEKCDSAYHYQGCALRILGYEKGEKEMGK